MFGKLLFIKEPAKIDLAAQYVPENCAKIDSMLMRKGSMMKQNRVFSYKKEWMNWQGSKDRC